MASGEGPVDPPGFGPTPNEAPEAAAEPTAVGSESITDAEPAPSAEGASSEPSEPSAATSEPVPSEGSAELTSAEAAPAEAPPGDTTKAPEPPVPGLRPKPHEAAKAWLRDYFLGEDPQFLAAVVPFCFLSMLLFTRHPIKTNFIFDEQEALLANPYVRSVMEKAPKFHWLDAFKRDFWGLGPERSIGSYRPIPNLVWRFLWMCGAREHNPFLHHWVNVLFHGANGALLTLILWRLTKRPVLAWLGGMFLVASAVLTEAVSGVVGIADVFGTFGCLVALYALTLRMPFMAFWVVFGSLFGLYSKESAMIVVPMVPLFALATASSVFPDKPRRVARTLVAFVAAAASFVFYVESRRRWFPAPIPEDAKAIAKGGVHKVFASLMKWYGQPVLPKDPLNNPLALADTPHRIAGALRVYFRGLGQVVFPKTLSGDYSSPQEPIPSSLFSVEIVLGALCLVLPVPVAAALGIRSFLDGRRAKEGASAAPAGTDPEAKPAAPAAAPVVDARPLVAASLVWIVASYFPVSNIPILLPTVRAERFWYFPVVGSSIVLAVMFDALLTRAKQHDAASGGVSRTRVGLGFAGAALVLAVASFLVTDGSTGGTYVVLAGVLIYGVVQIVRATRDPSLATMKSAGAVVAACVAFTVFQGVAARVHANDYTTDLTFWDATRKAVPNSAKAHLNYSVMKGARGDLEARRIANLRALELAPEWPMASIYLGDTICRQHKPQEAWPHYMKGFALAPNDVNLLSLGIQCLWDEKVITMPKAAEGDDPPPEPARRVELRELAAKHKGSWLEWLTNDIVANGESHNGVDPKYRPRGYNEGPKE